MRARRTTAFVLVGLLCGLAVGVPWGLGGASGGPALAAEVRNPDGVAVIIGNRHYAHQDVPDVEFAHRDAAAFRRYAVEILGYEPANIIDVRDASLARMMELFGNERSHEGDLYWMLDPAAAGRSDVVVFYSGHGVPGLADKEAYLLPAEAAPDNAEISAYPLALLYDNLGKLTEARSVRVFMDACFSGNSHAGMLIRRASPASATPRLPGAAGEKLTVLTAAAADQIASWDEDARHGLFTRHLLDALYGGGDADGDGQVTSSEAKAYLDREMTGAARQLRRRQRASLIEGPQTTVLSARPEAGFPARRPIALMTEAGIPLEDLSPAATRLARMLGRPFSAEAADEVGWTDLHYAAVLDLPELIGALIDAGVPADIRLKDGSPPFGEPLKETLSALGHEKFGDWTADGETPLMIAAATNSDAATRELIAHGADIALPNTGDGTMPLHYAVWHNAVDAIAEFIAHGADVNGRIGGDSWMPLHVAAHWNAGAAVAFLLHHGADIGALSLTDKDAFPSFTPLGHAAASNALEAMRALIDGGANVNDGALPIASSRNRLESVKLLIENGANVNMVYEEWDGITALHWTGSPPIIEHLIVHGADVDFKDKKGRTPLHLVAEFMHELDEILSPETARALINFGADVNARNQAGETPLHVAARKGSRELLVALIEGGADIRAKTNAGATVLDLWETEM